MRDVLCDVAVIGGGPHGLTYARWVRRNRPDTRLLVLERQGSPGYKIGESTLSSATRSFLATGLSQPVLRRLFGNKEGIRFWWTSPESGELERHVDVVGIEESFQVERRILETAMRQSAERSGIEVMTGTRVILAESRLDGEWKELQCERDGERFVVRCRHLCDASGPASVLARHLGTYRRAPERHDTFTTNSYYGYFRLKGSVPVEHWEEPATRHICFPGGWTWFINVVSWQQTPQENLERMVGELLEHVDQPEELVPTRDELARRHDCSYEQIVSIGFTVRADRDPARRMNARDAFAYYRDRHPAIAAVMEQYEEAGNLYGMHPGSYGLFRDLVHDSTSYSGAGWCSVGDAAAFVNPLFSPGLNLGSGSCYMAARETASLLEGKSIAEGEEYDAYMRRLYEALLTENDLYYRSFEHPDAYEWGIMLKIAWGSADVARREMTYEEKDAYAHDLLDPVFRDLVERGRGLLREGEESGTDVGATAVRLRRMIRDGIREHWSRPDVRQADLGRHFSHYTIDARRVKRRRRRRRAFETCRCKRCASWYDDAIARCPVCGG